MIHEWYANQILTDYSAGAVTGTINAPMSVVALMASAHGVAGTVAGNIVIATSITATHGVGGAISGSILPVVSMAGTHTASGVSGTISGQIVPAVAMTGAHGVSGVIGGAIIVQAIFAGTHTAPDITGIIAGQIFVLANFEAQFGNTLVPQGGAFGPSGKRYYRRYNVYDVESGLEKVAQSAQRSTSRNARKQQLAKVQRSLGELFSSVDAKSDLPLSILDLKTAYDASMARATQDFVYAQWKDNVLRSVNQALIELRLQIEIIEEEDNDMLLMVL
jgi:hypothetical protein